MPLSRPAGLVLEYGTFADRRYAIYLCRRVGAPVCFTVAALVTNAVRLRSPFDEDVPRHTDLEALRLLPVSWTILRVASPEFGAVDERVGEPDDVLPLSLLSRRDPALWKAPRVPARALGRPRRRHPPGHLPFGHESERCWGRHMVMPLAGRLLDLLRRDGLAVGPDRTTGRVELDGLLEVSHVRVTRR